MSLGFMYGSFNIAFILKEIAALGFSAAKSIGVGTAKAIAAIFRTILKPVIWADLLTSPNGKTSKLLIVVGLLIVVWLWLRRLKESSMKAKKINK